MLRVLYFVPSGVANRSHMDSVYGMKQAAKMFPWIEVSVFEKDAHSFKLDTEVLSAIAMQVDALITIGKSEKEYLPYYQKLIDEGILLVLIDSDLPQVERSIYVGPDNEALGEQAAEFLLDTFPGENLRACVLSPRNTTAGLMERFQGFENIASQSDQLEIIDQELNLGIRNVIISAKLEEMMEKSPEINTILCLDATTTVSALNLLIERGLIGKVHLVGFDCDSDIAEAIENGEIDAVFAQKESDNVGYLSIQLLAEYSPDSEPLVQYITYDLLTKETIGELWREEE
ncbi:MAG: substrate-binding domain-containing protein [Lachnospiraceae bacterium]|nr:substrate-binding domain-containing protein [Robinsoniella sp.]MDY3765710.1 substrate-binding domain-containing protein [Lachnospiraceae bacterium]